MFTQFWRAAHPFSTFLVICFCYFWFVFWLVAFCQRYYRLVFFDVCFLLAGFCLASYRGVGVGCETPHLRSISPNFPYVFCALLIFYASASTGLQGGLVSWYPLSPLLLRRRYSSRKRNNWGGVIPRGRGVIARSLRDHLSEVLWANNNTNTLWVNE